MCGMKERDEMTTAPSPTRERASGLRWVVLGTVFGLIMSVGSTGLAFHGPTGCVLIQGTGSSETLNGQSGCDHIWAGGGQDTVFARAGRDGVHGEDHTDTIHGMDYDDTLYGDDGNDDIIGGNGFDTCFGGPGLDAFTTCEAGTT